MTLLFEQTIRIGDHVDLGDKSGEVVYVGTGSSRIKTYDNAILIVPNSEFATRQVLNWSVGDPGNRLVVPISVAHGSDPERVMPILLEIARLQSGIMRNPAPEVIFSEIGPHAITFTIYLWTLKNPHLSEN